MPTLTTYPGVYIEELSSGVHTITGVATSITAFVGYTAKPDYTMTSYVQFIPAKVAPTDNAVNASLRNPWNQLGLATLGQASICATQSATPPC